MFGRSMFSQMEQDPFFAEHAREMRRMEGMFGSPFRGMGMLEGGQSQLQPSQRPSQNTAPRNDMVMPFGGNMFDMFNQQMSQMSRMMENSFAQAQSGQAGGNGVSYVQSSFSSYQKTPDGPAKVFQASQATKTGPNGVRETKKALRDSEREIEKMSIGHHIHNRGHEVEKHRNTRSGQIEEMQNYHNLDEKDAESFHREWHEKAGPSFRDFNRSGRDDRQRQLDYDHRRRDRGRDRGERQLALPDTRSPTGSEDRRSEHWGQTRRRDRS